jgi:hypothetical protein
MQEGERRAIMIRQDFIFLALVVMGLYFIQWEAGHWKH